MKKKFAILATLATVFTIGSLAVTTPFVKASATRVDYVGYVDEADAPVIDGVVDEVWKDASKLYTKTGASFGYASVLWNEDGMYYLGTVWDSTICSKDMCAFWISEDYNLNKRWIEWYYPSSECTYDADGKSGAYYVQVFANGEYYLSCNGSEKCADVQVAVTKDEKAGEWIAEIYIPHMGDNTLLKEHGRVGFEYSIDDYDSDDDSKASVVKWMWQHSWPYRTNYTALGKIILCKSDESSTENTYDTERTAAPVNNDGISSQTQETGGSCNASIATVGIGALLGGVSVCVKKRKR